MSSSLEARRNTLTPEARKAASEAVVLMESALEGTRAVKQFRDDALVDQADYQLRAAVDAARKAGVKWGEIGEVLGIARGNAYQRYRR
jgi:hypothetical protein